MDKADTSSRIATIRSRTDRKRSNIEDFSDNFSKSLKIDDISTPVSSNTCAQVAKYIEHKYKPDVTPLKIIITYPETGVEDIHRIMSSIPSSSSQPSSSTTSREPITSDDHLKVMLSTIGRLILRVNDLDGKYKHLNKLYENIVIEKNEYKQRLSDIEKAIGYNPISSDKNIKRNYKCRYKSYDNLADMSDDDSDDDDNDDPSNNIKGNGNEKGKDKKKKDGKEFDNPMLNNISYCV
jgi:hypothetical protein